MDITVNFDRLQNLVEGYIDTFNDCLCCPCSYNGCNHQDEGIDCDDCAYTIIAFLRKELGE